MWYSTMGYHMWCKWLCALAYNLAAWGTKILGLLYWNISHADIYIPHVPPTGNFMLMHLTTLPSNVGLLLPTHVAKWVSNMLCIGQGYITKANSLDYAS